MISDWKLVDYKITSFLIGIDLSNFMQLEQISIPFLEQDLIF